MINDFIELCSTFSKTVFGPFPKDFMNIYKILYV